jgi:hypothetical protein
VKVGGKYERDERKKRGKVLGRFLRFLSFSQTTPT